MSQNISLDDFPQHPFWSASSPFLYLRSHTLDPFLKELPLFLRSISLCIQFFSCMCFSHTFSLLSSVHIWLVICVFSFFSSRALCNMLLEWIEGKMGKYFLRNFPFSKVKFSLAFLPYLSLVFPLYLDSPRACLSHTFHCYRCIFEFA